MSNYTYQKSQVTSLKNISCIIQYNLNFAVYENLLTQSEENKLAYDGAPSKKVNFNSNIRNLQNKFIVTILLLCQYYHSEFYVVTG